MGVKSSVKRLTWFCISVLLLCSVPAVLLAEVEIVTKDGKVFNVPVKKKQIKSIVIDGKEYYPHAKRGSWSEKKQIRGQGEPGDQRLAETSSQLAKVIRVGPGREIELPSDAAGIAGVGDTIEIDTAEYFGDVAVWRADNITIRGVNGRPHLNAGGKSAQGKAIWVIRGNNVTVENIEFSNTKVRDRNGAGIRSEGNNLTVRNCVFRDNEEGILGGGNRDSTMLVEHCEFARNGYGDGQSHGIYVSLIKRLTFQYNYVHHSKIGHQVKSRAQENFILYNKLVDEKTGNSSYAIDMPNGHLAVVIGNVLQQSKFTDNHALVHFQAQLERPGSGLYLINNTVVNERQTGIFLINQSPVKAIIANNILVGNIKLVAGDGSGENNVRLKFSDFVDPRNYDFHLRAGASAIDAGIDLENTGEISLRPSREYVHPIDSRERPNVGRLDAGAFEFEPPRP